VEELFKMMQIIVAKPTNASEQEVEEVTAFKRNTLQLYLQVRISINQTIYHCFLACQCTLFVTNFQFLVSTGVRW